MNKKNIILIFIIIFAFAGFVLYLNTKIKGTSQASISEHSGNLISPEDSVGSNAISSEVFLKMTYYGDPASLEKLSDLENLKSLEINIETEVENLQIESNSIIRLELSGGAIKSLDGISGITSLEELVINSQTLTDISEIGELSNLRVLEIYSQDRYSGAESIGKLVNLEKLCLRGDNNNDFLESLSKIEYLEMYNESSINDMPYANSNSYFDFENICQMKNLKVLKISGYRNILNLELLSNNTDLEDLMVVTTYEYTGVSCLSELEKLKNLEISVYSTLPFIENLESLKVDSLDSIKMIENLSHVKYLSIDSEYTELENLRGISAFEQLEALYIGCYDADVDFEELDKLRTLEKLCLDCYWLSGGECLFSMRHMTNLKELSISNAYFIEDLDFIGENYALESLYIMDSGPISDISALSDLDNLKYLSLNYCLENADLLPLESCLSLEEVYIDGKEYVFDKEGE